jgi:hypothetical protein
VGLSQLADHPWLVACALAGAAWPLTAHGSDPADYRLFAAAGTQVIELHWGAVFADPTVQTGPVSLLAFGTWAKALAALNCSPAAVAGLTVFAMCLVNALCAVAVVRVLTAGWPPSRRGAAIGLVGLLSLAAGVLSLDDAHPTHAAIALLWVLVVRAARRGRVFSASLLLGLACSLDSWAVLGVGALVLLPTRRDVVTAGSVLVAACALAWGPFVLSGHFESGSMVWRPLPRSLPGQLFGSGDVPWGYRLAQAVLVVSVTAAVARRRPDTDALCWALPALAFSLRLASDPLDFGYYANPLLILLCAGAVTGVLASVPGPFPRSDGHEQVAWLQQLWPVPSICAASALVAVTVGRVASGPLLGYSPAVGLVLLAILRRAGSAHPAAACLPAQARVGLRRRDDGARGHAPMVSRGDSHV